MDTRLIFRDSLHTIKTDGGTQHPIPGAQWLQAGETVRSGLANPPGRLPGKSSKECGAIRTTNRHRWTSVNVLRRSGDGMSRN